MTTNGPEVQSDRALPQWPAASSGGRAAARGVTGAARMVIALSGIIAGLAAFGIGEASSEWIPPDRVQFDFFGTARERVSRDTPRVVVRTAALAFAVLGLCLGGFLGLAGGLARLSVPAAVAAGALGAVLGALLGAGTTLGLLRFSMEVRSEYPNNDLVIGIVVHGVIWGLLGAAAGLACALGLGERRLIGRAIAAGFAGALVGAIAFDVMGAFAFPLAKTDGAISLTSISRLLARLLVGFGTAAAIAGLMPTPRPDPDRAPEPSIATTTAHS